MAVRVYERETDDWAHIPVIQDGTTYTGNWSYQIVPYGDRPTGTWTTAVVNGGLKGVDIQGLVVGYYTVFIRIDGLAGYAPVVENTDYLVIT